MDGSTSNRGLLIKLLFIVPMHRTLIILWKIQVSMGDLLRVVLLLLMMGIHSGVLPIRTMNLEMRLRSLSIHFLLVYETYTDLGLLL